MTFVNYIGTEHTINRAELIFQSDEWSHILILGTDTVAVVPNEDIAPCQGSYPQDRELSTGGSGGTTFLRLYEDSCVFPELRGFMSVVAGILKI